jgi:hypothetical protein
MRINREEGGFCGLPDYSRSPERLSQGAARGEASPGIIDESNCNGFIETGIEFGMDFKKQKWLGKVVGELEPDGIQSL